jgi:hypothetical protein
MFRFFISNYQCKHILFAGCHDNGYLNTLQQYQFDEAMVSRISLIESIPAQSGFGELGFPLIRFESVFRPDELPKFAPSISIPLRRNSQPREQSTLVGSDFVKPSTMSPIQTPAATPTSTSSNCWATVGKSNVTSKSISIIPTARKPNPPRKYYLLNKSGHRIDDRLEKPDPQTWKSMNERIYQQKLCNLYHLKGPEYCHSGDNCTYQHGEKLSTLQKQALRLIARRQPCTSRGHCDDFDCMYGHNCPFGPTCQRQTCNWTDYEWHHGDTVSMPYSLPMD